MDEPVSDLMNKPWVIPALAAASGLVVGGIAGYFYGRRNGATEIYHIVRPEESDKIPGEDEEGSSILRSISEDIPNLPPNHPPGVDVATDQDLEELVDGTEIVIKPAIPAAEEAMAKAEEADVIINVFANGKEDDWNWEEELASRENDMPYILHEEEFMEKEEPGLSQTTMTYYAGDDILCDSADTPIYGWDTVVGPLKFGHGSSDDNSFYVRNERLKGEYEILRDPGRFSEIVLGLEAESAQAKAELKHSKNLRFRPDD